MNTSSHIKKNTKTEEPKKSTRKTRRYNDPYLKSIESRPDSIPKEFEYLYQEALLLALREEGFLDDMEYDLCSETLESQYYRAAF